MWFALQIYPGDDKRRMAMYITKDGRMFWRAIDISKIMSSSPSQTFGKKFQNNKVHLEDLVPQTVPCVFKKSVLFKTENMFQLLEYCEKRFPGRRLGDRVLHIFRDARVSCDYSHMDRFCKVNVNEAFAVNLDEEHGQPWAVFLNAVTPRVIEHYAYLTTKVFGHVNNPGFASPTNLPIVSPPKTELLRALLSSSLPSSSSVAACTVKPPPTPTTPPSTSPVSLPSVHLLLPPSHPSRIAYVEGSEERTTLETAAVPKQQQSETTLPRPPHVTEALHTVLSSQSVKREIRGGSSSSSSSSSPPPFSVQKNTVASSPTITSKQPDSTTAGGRHVSATATTVMTENAADAAQDVENVVLRLQINWSNRQVQILSVEK